MLLTLYREILGSEPCWQYLLASNAVPGFIQLLTLPWFPESPRYLLIDRGDKEACFAGKKFFATDFERGAQTETVLVRSNPTLAHKGFML